MRSTVQLSRSDISARAHRARLPTLANCSRKNSGRATQSDPDTKVTAAFQLNYHESCEDAIRFGSCPGCVRVGRE